MKIMFQKTIYVLLIFMCICSVVMLCAETAKEAECWCCKDAYCQICSDSWAKCNQCTECCDHEPCECCGEHDNTTCECFKRFCTI